CEFCLLCVFTHDASKGCIQPSGVTPLQRGNAALDALSREEDAQRPEQHADAKRRTIVVSSVSFSDSEQFVLHRVFDEIGQ
uniref:hypothetical protein n=1 Tax=Pseudomonas syringae group genomosp. 3 TaxID=251701 RepID=UPI001F27CEE2